MSRERGRETVTGILVFVKRSLGNLAGQHRLATLFLYEKKIISFESNINVSEFFEASRDNNLSFVLVLLDFIFRTIYETFQSAPTIRVTIYEFLFNNSQILFTVPSARNSLFQNCCNIFSSIVRHFSFARMLTLDLQQKRKIRVLGE